MKRLLKNLRSCATLLALFTLLLGFVYPMLVTALSQAAFHHKANGSLLVRGDTVIGSSLLGQDFHSAKYFWCRPSATSPAYNASASSGSNMSPANPKLLQTVNQRIAALQKADPGNKSRIPVDLVTASASGLDPHISLQSAYYQLSRVARARGMKEADVNALINANTHVPAYGLLGEAYVNVVELNYALDKGPGSGIQDSGKNK